MVCHCGCFPSLPPAKIYLALNCPIVGLSRVGSLDPIGKRSSHNQGPASGSKRHDIICTVLQRSLMRTPFGILADGSRAVLSARLIHLRATTGAFADSSCNHTFYTSISYCSVWVCVYFLYCLDNRQPHQQCFAAWSCEVLARPVCRYGHERLFCQ